MNLLAELLANAGATRRLKPKYYVANSIVGLLAVLVGLGVLYLVSRALLTLLGLNAAEDLSQARYGTLWLALFIVAIPVSFFGSAVPVAWASGWVFVRMGFMAPGDVRYYALRSRFPVHWLKGLDPEPPG